VSRLPSLRHPLLCSLLWLALAWSCGSAAGAAELRVAVASNFAQPMARIAAAFSAASGDSVKLSAASTGKLQAQIIAGAPFDLLLAADDDTPRRLIASGHAVAETQHTYAIGRLVLWSADPKRVDDQGAVLADGDFSHLAIANPKTAPYGRAAMELLRSRGLLQRLTPRLVTGESIAQAQQFVATGNAELGLIALSQLQRPEGRAAGSMWLVPATLHAPIRQDAVLLRSGQAQPAARALLQYLQSDAARAVMREYGYEH
jgi:molybdate transport system substrate-binding protein